MNDPRQRIMSILQGFDTGTLVKMLETEGVHLDIDSVNEGSSSVAQHLDREPLESGRSMNESTQIRKGPGSIFRVQEQQPARAVNAPNQQPGQQYLENPPPEYMQQYGAGGGTANV
jgi:hypothetical protein